MERDFELARGSARDVFLVALKLGCTSFGGPIAHLGYFRNEYVVQQKWIDDEAYADLVALCQFLPGPASSQVGIAIGTIRAGYLGGILAWIGFTVPSAVLMVLFAVLIGHYDVESAGWVSGLKIVAVAIVAQAVWGMGRQFCVDRVRIVIGILATLISLTFSQVLTQVVVILLAGLAGWLLIRIPTQTTAARATRSPISHRAAVLFLCGFVLGALMLPVLNARTSLGTIEVVDTMYRAGALVFGGGHAVLPILQKEVVEGGWLSTDRFVAGYGMEQAMPGPLFSFAAFLGADRSEQPNGILGAAIALVAIFIPSFLMIFGALPFWNQLRVDQRFRSALAGINAAVVGILLAALYNPIWQNAIHQVSDLAIAAAGFALLMVWRWPSWQVVIFSAVAAQLAALWF